MNIKFSKFPWHVILFPLYPPLSLWAYNLGQIGLTATYRAILACLFLGILLLGLTWLWLRDWAHAGIVTSIFLLLFFSYGHTYFYLETINISGFVIGRHRFLVFIWLILLVLGVWWAVKKVKSPFTLHSTLNLISAFLIVFPLFKLATYGFSHWQDASANSTNATARAIADATPPTESRPDVYYIILDGYGRSDVLRNQLNFDNSSFLDSLRSEGFYVAQCSQSNYGMTALSLSTSPPRIPTAMSHFGS
jgi:hypothetical protein